MVKKQGPKAKRRYLVYKVFESGSVEYFDQTQAVSEIDATNNVRYRYWQNTSVEMLQKEFHFHLAAALAKSLKDIKLFARTEQAKRFRSIRVYRPQQLELFGHVAGRETIWLR